MFSGPYGTLAQNPFSATGGHEKRFLGLFADGGDLQTASLRRLVRRTDEILQDAQQIRHSSICGTESSARGFEHSGFPFAKRSPASPAHAGPANTRPDTTRYAKRRITQTPAVPAPGRTGSHARRLDSFGQFVVIRA